MFEKHMRALMVMIAPASNGRQGAERMACQADRQQPTSIHVSPDVLALLQKYPNPLPRKMAGGYVFDGVPIQATKGQVLPFKFRP